MVDKDYLLAQPSAPSAMKATIDQRVIPALIDVAGSIEGRLETVARTVRQSPTASVLIALGIGFLAAHARRSRV